MSNHDNVSDEERIEKGDRVRLPDGREGTVLWVIPSGREAAILIPHTPGTFHIGPEMLTLLAKGEGT